MIDDQVALDRIAGLRMLIAVELSATRGERLDVKLSRTVAAQIEEALAYAAAVLLQAEPMPPAPRWARPALNP